MRGRPSPARHWCSGRGRRSPLAAVTRLGSLFTTDKGSTSFLTAHYYVCFLLPESKRAPRVLFSRRLIFAFLLIGDFLRRVFFTAARAHLHESLKHERDRVFQPNRFSVFVCPRAVSPRTLPPLYSFLTRLPIFTSLGNGVAKTESNVGVSGCVVFCKL